MIVRIHPKTATWRKAEMSDLNRIESLRKHHQRRGILPPTQIILSDDKNYHVQVIEENKEIVAYYILRKIGKDRYILLEKVDTICEGRFNKKFMPFCIDLNATRAKGKVFKKSIGNLCLLCKNYLC
jgi:hypothetical protein